jgi:membrane-bound serine protease (ClpP class)
VNNQAFDFTFVASEQLSQSMLSVLLGMVGAVVVVMLTWNKVMGSHAMQHVVLSNTFQSNEGYRSSNTAEHLIGKTGIAYTRMTPSGRIMIDDIMYDAQARDGFIEKGDTVQVIDHSTFALRVKKLEV